jgi:hypothetical protein
MNIILYILTLFNFYSFIIINIFITNNIYFHNINGIPISSINANFPITVDNINGYHIINNIYNNNFFSINIDYYSINNSNISLIIRLKLVLARN